jgi:hypothetical protein
LLFFALLCFLLPTLLGLPLLLPNGLFPSFLLLLLSLSGLAFLFGLFLPLPLAFCFLTQPLLLFCLLLLFLSPPLLFRLLSLLRSFPLLFGFAGCLLGRFLGLLARLLLCQSLLLLGSLLFALLRVPSLFLFPLRLAEFFLVDLC